MTTKWILSLAALAAVCVAEASPFAYAINYHQDLMRLDLNSSATVMIGNIGFTGQGLAALSTGQLLATDTNGKLHDVTGGGNVLMGNLGALDIGSIDSTGTTLWGYDNTSQRMFEYDPTSATFLQWSPTLSIPNLRALTIDANGDFLFVSPGAAFGVDRFGKITKSTWTVNQINSNMGLADHCEAMDFLSDGKLYAAVLGDTRYEIDPTTGIPIAGFFSGTHRDWSDMTSATAVPEPATLATLGLLGVGLFRRRKRG